MSNRQPEGSVKRVYMCTTSADRFKDGCTVKPTKKQIIAAKKAGTVDKLTNRITNRWGLCLGTIGTERVDQKKDKIRTSLSTPLYEREMCNVAKVHAIWEPQQPGAAESGYDARRVTSTFDTDRDIKRVLRVADALGLRPVGWIYSYSQDRHVAGGDDEDSLPVYASDIYLRCRVADWQHEEQTFGTGGGEVYSSRWRWTQGVVIPRPFN